MDGIVFTPAAVLDLLTQIDELNEYEVGIAETPDGHLQLTVGTSVYDISDSEISDVPVEQQTVDDIADINEETYENMSEESNVDVFPIESGVLKEITKTLLVGGLVRLTKKLLK